MIKLEIDDPRLDPFRDLKGRDAFTEGTLVAESSKVIQKLLDTSTAPLALLASERDIESCPFDHTKFPQVFLLSDSEIKKLVGYHYHQGFIALATRAAATPLDALGPHVLILNGITSPENVGTLIRTAAGLGITDVLLDSKTCHPHVRRAIRVSMGNIFYMRWHQTYDLPGAIKKLNQRGINVIGSANDPGSLSINDFSWKGQGQAIVIGSEGHGMDDAVRVACEQLVYIPINEKVAHLNAAGAGAILMHEMLRVRRA
tara:strand:- start:16757 stop:17530 length:774 start_codon:yes stop_codon:yes gene_type:complete